MKRVLLGVMLLVFNRVNYCPLTCNTNPTDPACTNCMQGGSGSF
jgi:hypothetical protein